MIFQKSFWHKALVLIALASPAYLAAGTAVTPTDTPTTTTLTPTPTATDIPSTATMTPTATPSPTVTASPSPTVSPTATPAPPAVVRSTLRTSTPPFTYGSRILVFVEVSQNLTGFTPINANFEIRYDTTKLKYFGIQSGQLGQAIAGPLQATGPDGYFFVVTLSNPSNRDSTPTVMTLAFDVIAPSTTTLDITVADARNSSGPLIGPTSGNRIPHVFDNSGIQSLPIIVALPDIDGDGISNVDEVTRGTKVNGRDSDNDGVEDGIEVALGTNPLLGTDHPNGKVDSDADGLPDDRDSAPTNADRDGDRIKDGYEVAQGTDPDSASSFPPIGDLDSSGATEFIDGVLLYAYYLGNLPPAGDPQRRDVNRDGIIDFTDGVIIFNYHLGNFRLLPF